METKLANMMARAKRINILIIFLVAVFSKRNREPLRVSIELKKKTLEKVKENSKKL